MSTKPSCRLHVYLANDAKKAVILRRGPTRWFHLILWHMQTDKFEFGSWFHGRIYEDRCDLSPDGRHFVYFAMTDSSNTANTLGGYAWTAICNPPWVKAITLEVSSCGTWGGGGRFVTEADSDFSSAEAIDFLGNKIRLSHASSRRSQQLPPASVVENADWIGIDHRNRLIYVIGGQLWRCYNTRAQFKNPKLIANFSDLTPPSRMSTKSV